MLQGRERAILVNLADIKWCVAILCQRWFCSACSALGMRCSIITIDSVLVVEVDSPRARTFVDQLKDSLAAAHAAHQQQLSKVRAGARRLCFATPTLP